MAAVVNSRSSAVTSAATHERPARPAAAAAARVARAEALVGLLGAAASLFVVMRLVETWRVTPHTASHLISVLGVTLSYPVANFAALVVLALALLGLAVTARAMIAAIRELVADRRFRRAATAHPSPLGPEALVVDDERPLAFCAGLIRPRVYVSSAALELLDEDALAAVLLHERQHARRRDPLRLAAGRVLAGALFYVPGLRGLVRHQQALAEISADEHAVEAAGGDRSALARAMLTFLEVPEAGGVDPARVDHLLGETPAWRFPFGVCVAAVAGLLTLIAVAILAAQVAAGAATLAPPFLSSQPCVVVLAMIPAALAVGVRRHVRRVARRAP